MSEVTCIWGASGSGLSEHAWTTAEETGAAWVGNDASAHISLLRPTVREELAFGMEQQGIPRGTMRSRIAEALDLWDLGALADRDPSELSTGQTRRVAVAAALLRDPGALVLDCPTDGLDAGAVDTLRSTIGRFDGPVTIYDRVATSLATLTERHLHLQDGVLTPAPVPGPVVPERGRRPVPPFPGETVLDCDLTTTNGSFTLSTSLRAKAGQVTHLAGPNGSGKTTVMLAVLGLLPWSGRLTAPLTGWVPTAMDVSFSQRTVARELAVGSDRDHAAAALDWVGLTPWSEVHPLDVPSSVRRMVAVAAGLVRGPRLLLVDEPTVGLDAPGHSWLARVLRDYAAGGYHERLGEPGTRPAVVWTCHNAGFAAAVSDVGVELGVGSG